MGKGFENYMSKKWFHPTNMENQKRKFLAEKKETEHTKRQDDLREQYAREQEEFCNKQLIGDEKARLGLSFMYNAPALLKDQKEDNNNNKKSLMPTTSDGSDAPPPVFKDRRKTQCMKCRRFGHANTDKVCPLYGRSRLDVDVTLDAEAIAQQSTKSTLHIKQEAVDADNDQETATAAAAAATTTTTTQTKSAKGVEKTKNEAEEDDGLSLDMLRNLPRKQKKHLLKRLRKLAKKITRST